MDAGYLQDRPSIRLQKSGESGGITTDSTEMGKIIREHHEQLHVNKLGNLERTNS